MQPKQSYWEVEAFFKNIDIIIIGSGIVGLTAAIHCKTLQPHLKVLIIERGALPIGASTRNAGFACFGSLTELLDDLEHQTEAEMLTLVERRWKGLLRLRKRLGDQHLAYKEWGGYEIFKKEEQASYEACMHKRAYLNEQLADIIGIKNIYNNADHKIKEAAFEGVAHIIENKAEGQIHTGKMMAQLLKMAQSKGVQILNGISIEKVEEEGKEVALVSEQGWHLKSKKVLIATNGFAQKLLPNLAVEAARNQVLITKEIPNLKIQGCFHYDCGYFYFRNINNRILLGGGRHLDKEGETTETFGMTHLIQKALTDLLKNVILPHQDIAIDRWWSGIMGIGKSKQPILKKASPNIGIAVRMGGMGVAIGSLIGEEGADLILDF